MVLPILVVPGDPAPRPVPTSAKAELRPWLEVQPTDRAAPARPPDSGGAHRSLTAVSHPILSIASAAEAGSRGHRLQTWGGWW